MISPTDLTWVVTAIPGRRSVSARSSRGAVS